MSRTSRTPRRRQRRHGFGVIRFMRGLIVETVGIATLAFLYVTLQSSSAVEVAGAPRNAEQIGVVSTATPAEFGPSTLWQQVQARTAASAGNQLQVRWPLWNRSPGSR